MHHNVKLILIVCSVLLMIVSPGCGIFSGLGPAAVDNLTVSESNDMINDNLKNQDFVILDVRTPEEFAEGHIDNAVNVDVEAADFDTKIKAFDTSKTYLVYCRSGRRSLVAAEKMLALGFKDVYNMLEGINSWLAAGYPVVK